MTESEAMRVLEAHVEVEPTTMLSGAIRTLIEARTQELRVYARLEQRFHELQKILDRYDPPIWRPKSPGDEILEDSLVALGLEYGDSG